ncbi:MAG: hypothetical protein IK137_04015 [Bacilli bacterium]|nr:hypothetical protein [Bacilli bacterium]
MKNIKINDKTLSELFNSADERIFLNKKEKLQIEDGPRQQELRAKVYVDALAELVYYTLSKAKHQKGRIRIPLRLRKHLGKVGSGTSKTPGSYYELGDENLKIVLDYSNEYHNSNMVTWYAKSCLGYVHDKDVFCSKNGIATKDQISAALNKYGFGMKYVVGTMESEDKTILIEVEMYTITVKRIKDKVDDSKPYIKV